MTELQVGKPASRPIWPVLTIAFGLGATAAWVGLLVYGLANLIKHAI